MSSLLRSTTVSPNAFIASPNGISCFPNLSMSLFPVKKPSTPPVFGSVDAISAIIFPAVAAVSTSSLLRSFTVLANSCIASPNGISCSPNLGKGKPPVRNDVTPCTISAAVRMSIVSANAFTPDNTPSSKFDTVSKNGDAFSINAAKLLPTSTNPAVEDAKKPPTIFPKNDPKPYPIFSRIDKPLSKNSSIPG